MVSIILVGCVAWLNRPTFMVSSGVVLSMWFLACVLFTWVGCDFFFFLTRSWARAVCTLRACCSGSVWLVFLCLRQSFHDYSLTDRVYYVVRVENTNLEDVCGLTVVSFNVTQIPEKSMHLSNFVILNLMFADLYKNIYFNILQICSHMQSEDSLGCWWNPVWPHIFYLSIPSGVWVFVEAYCI